ncbi:MAG: type II toxin-antitoxin system RelE/ParE family toxin [Promethearchaeati archaeon SRVP18_Atabeyarchaeia-1]
MQKKRYEVRVSKDFEREFIKLVKRDPELKRRLESRIEELSIDPRLGTTLYKWDYQGWRKARVGEYRIILGVCEECRQIRNPNLQRCIDCDQMTDNLVKLIEVGHRNDVYDD